MVTMRLLLLLLAVLFAWPAAGAPKTTTTARLILSHEAAKPGETVMAGVQLRMAPKWHTYWENSGESGAPTTVEWTLPDGFSAGSILWPVPERFVTEGLITYVHHDIITLLVPISIPTNAPVGPVDLKAKVSWFECNDDTCVPGNAAVSTRLIVAVESKASANAGSIEAAKKKLPTPKPASFARASWADAGEKQRLLAIEWTAVGGNTPVKFDFFPYTNPKATILASNQVTTVNAGKVQLRKMVEKSEVEWPSEVAGLIVEQAKDDTVLGAYEVRLPVEAKAGSAAAAGSGAFAGEKRPLLVWLVFGFLGGLILNLMPCVLPVIALKIFGFVAQAHEAPGRARQLGVIYGLGVLSSFLVLAGVVIAVQGAGRLASWGMQFGNPYFMVGMTTLMTLVALNFFGLFEIMLGGGAMGTAANLAGREGKSGAFFNGVLATVLATPCTAPFLAPALGFAFGQPAVVIVMMFCSVGLGLAAPYVLLSFQPGWLKFLPKPGAWMEKFKTAMGFPMLATALWLLSVLNRHYGADGILWVGMFLVFVSLSAWIWGEFVQRGSRRKGLAMALSLGFAIGGYALTLEGQLEWRNREKAAAKAAAGGGIVNQPGGIQWQKWSKAAVEAARSQGRPVFVEFTSATCINCKLNKRSSIEIDSTRAKLKAIDAVTLLGDWTLVPDDITEELQRFGRAGVPLVLVYPKDASKAPIVLPTLLTPAIVLDALEQAAK